MKILEIIMSMLSDIFGKKTPDVSRPAHVAPDKPLVIEPKFDFNSLPYKVSMVDLASRKWKGIVWHHSYSTDRKQDNDWDNIVRYHTSYRIDGHIVTELDFNERKRKKDGRSFQRPWNGVGYHGGVEYENGEPVWKWGRGVLKAGAHAAAKGNGTFNRSYLGFCSIGNYDLSPPSDAMWLYCLRVSKYFMDAYGIPVRDIIGHREVYARLGIPQEKSCPGNLWGMDKFRSDIVKYGDELYTMES